MSADQPALLSLVIPLRPLQATPHRPAWWGRAVHRLALEVIRRYDPALAESLHTGDRRRPFTVSSLLGLPAEGPLDPQQVTALRLTAIQPQVAAVFQQARTDGPLAAGRQVELEYIAFEIGGDAPAELRAWQGQADYPSLAGNYLLQETAPGDRLALHFASPVQFRSQGKVLPLPLPEQVFGSLLRRWNDFSPLPFDRQLYTYVSEQIVLGSFELHSRYVPGKDGALQIGALGRAVYQARRADRYWLSVLHTLAEFALFSGVGAGVSQGLGQCRTLTTE